MIEILNTETHFTGDMELTIRVPEFDNFGHHMAEIERSDAGHTLETFETPDEYQTSSDQSAFDYDLELLNLVLSEEMPWDDEVQTHLDLFFAEWPGIRPSLLEETFHYYLDNYRKFRKAHQGNERIDLIVPNPEKPESIADLFRITSIHLWEDGAIGLGGYCTWDEENGFGAVIREGEIAAVGRETVAHQ